MARNSERLYIARPGAAAGTSTTVALAAATAKTVVACLGSSTDTLSLVRWSVSFDGVTATAVPAVVEVLLISTLGTFDREHPEPVDGIPVGVVCDRGLQPHGRADRCARPRPDVRSGHDGPVP